MITLSAAARAKIEKLLAAEARQDLVIRFGVEGRGRGGFRYRLAFVPRTEQRQDDVVVDLDGIAFLVDPQSVPHLNGVSLDHVETLQESGFKIDNPNSAWSDPKAAAIQRVLDHEINPAVASHGGYVELLDVKDDVAYIAMSGGCQGCGMADVTLRQGVEARIKEAVPEIRSVIDTTDHAGGTNPYYQSAQAGHSPLE